MAKTQRKTQPKTGEGRFTFAEYETWPTDEHWELIDGEAFAMTPGPGTAHQEVFNGLFYQLLTFFKEGPCRVLTDPYEFRLARPGQKEAEITDVVKPDLAVVCDPSRYDERGGIGAPDFVIEILSPPTASRDHVKKRRLYERHKVREFWLVDPETRLVTAYRRSRGSFGKADILDGEGLTLPVPAFPGLSIEFGKVFPPRPPVVREYPSVYRT